MVLNMSDLAIFQRNFKGDIATFATFGYDDVSHGHLDRHDVIERAVAGEAVQPDDLRAATVLWFFDSLYENCVKPTPNRWSQESYRLRLSHDEMMQTRPEGFDWTLPYPWLSAFDYGNRPGHGTPVVGEDIFPLMEVMAYVFVDGHPPCFSPRRVQDELKLCMAEWAVDERPTDDEHPQMTIELPPLPPRLRRLFQAVVFYQRLQRLSKAREEAEFAADWQHVQGIGPNVSVDFAAFQIGWECGRTRR